jgi:hypothetical protein
VVDVNECFSYAPCLYIGRHAASIGLSSSMVCSGVTADCGNVKGSYNNF